MVGDRKMPPGTVRLVDIEHTLSSKHAKGADHDIVRIHRSVGGKRPVCNLSSASNAQRDRSVLTLVLPFQVLHPAPSEDPEDPLYVQSTGPK